MVRAQEMDEILRQIGWTDGFNIPAINDENRELENEVASMLREKASLLASVVELDELLSSINSHATTLKAECSQNEGLLTAQQSQLDSEENLIKLLQGEEARLKSAIQLERQDRRAIQERCARIEAQLRHAEESTRDAENDAASGEAVRREWQKHEERASNAAKTLVDFYKQDDLKLKELELHRSRLQEEVSTCAKDLLEASSAVAALEQQLDSAAREYRAGLAERGNLVHRWESTAAGVRAREEASRHVIQETAQVRASLHLKQEQQNDARDFEENEARNNRELEARMRSLGQKVARLRSSINGQKQLKTALHDEVGTLQCQLAGCGSELSETRSRCTEVAALLKEREASKEHLAQSCEQRRLRLASLASLKGGTGERFTRLRTMLQEKERALTVLRQRAERLDLETVRANQEAAQLRQADETAVINLNAQKSSLRQLESQKNALERELERHRDMLLCLELSVQRQQLRVQRLSTEKAEKFEDPKLEERLKTLEITLTDKQATRDLLNRELRNIEKCDRHTSLTCLAARSELQEVQDQERALQASVEGGSHRFNEAEDRVSEGRSRLALLKARVSRRQEEVAQERATVLKLRTASLQAEHATKLQRSELGVETSSLAAEIAGVQHECAELRTAIANRKLRIQQLQNVYDITVKTMERNEGDPAGSDVVENATEYITRQRIRVAQEKGELVQHGNKLDDEIRRAEREIRAMEHTLAMVKAANDRYRSNLALPGAAAQPEDPELQAQIEDEERRNQELRAELQHIQESKHHMVENACRLREEVAGIAEHCRALTTSFVEREHDVAELQRELSDQDVKLKRASTQAKKISRELRTGNPGQATFEERDLELREMKRVTGTALRELWSVAENHVEARPLVARYLQEKNLPHVPNAPSPSQRLSAVAARASSRHSVTSAGPERGPSASPSLLNINFPDALSPTGSQPSRNKKF